MHRFSLVLVCGVVGLLGFARPLEGQTLSLAGSWRIALDPEDRGEDERWFVELPAASATIALPGTTDQAGIGYRLDPDTMTYPVDVLRVRWPGVGPTERADRAGHLVREHLYIGRAWYQRTVDVPAEWKGRYVRLRLERVLWATAVWLDGRPVGRVDSLVVEHRFDLGVLEPGTHTLSVRVDNGLVHNIGVIGHAYSPETQSRWNGIVGAIELTATERVFFRRVKIWPAADRGSLRAQVYVHNGTSGPAAGIVRWTVTDESGGGPYGTAESVVTCEPGERVLDAVVPITREVEPWDEFRPSRYRLVGRLELAAGDRRYRDEHVETFGFRHIERDGRHIRVNGRRVFLRGTLDCCVYPRTGHPPTDVDEWLRILGTIREYGFNHVRYHTWCPPDAAFEAADRLGLYLAPETPFWVDDWTVQNTPTQPKPLGRDPDVIEYVRREIARISDAYGNHPSFTFFSIGNEFGMAGTDWGAVQGLLDEAKRYDDRRLYNATAARRRVPSDDYWVTHRTETAGARGVGPAHTDWDFSAAARSVDLPVVAHETGQRPVFPDFDEMIAGLSGPLKPYNYRRLRDGFEASAVESQGADFRRASARFQLVQYKAEHEAMLRTADFAGYQLLMLNDFTGQSEALVGVLDPFWESKGNGSPKDVRRWNAPTVPLARFERFTWTAGETFQAAVDVAHYGARDLDGAMVGWSLESRSSQQRGKESISSGVLGPIDVPTGGLTRVGTVSFPFEELSHPAALVFRVAVGDAENEWPLWVYPPPDDDPEPATVRIARALDAETEATLSKGGRVLLLARDIESDLSARTGFLSVYWSAGWWGTRFSSLGLLCDPRHPALAEFPCQGHSDWQWHELAEGARTFDLDSAPRGFRPIVQPVPDFHFNRLLGQVFEVGVGPGRLLVVGYDLETDLRRRPAARQLRRSLLHYLARPDLDSAPQVPLQTVRRWLASTPAAPVVQSVDDRVASASLDVRAAAQLAERNRDVPWEAESDEALRRDDGFGWKVVTGGTWKDADGAAWHGNPLVVRLVVPRGTQGILFVHLHDWNGLGRRGTIRVEEQRYRVDDHAGAGRWYGFEISEETTRDGAVELELRATRGPNLMISRLAFIRRSAERD